MRIGSQNSISTLNLRNTSQVIARALERLSSGKRLNSPSDGIADYSTSIRLDSQIKGLAQVNLGLNQANGLLQTANSAISTQVDIVEQMRQIAIQGANSFLSTSERDSLNAELNNLRDEFNRIAQSTEFASIDLFNNPSGNISFLLDEENSLNIDSQNNLATDLFTKEIGNGTGSLIDQGIVGAEEDELKSADLNSDGLDDLILQDGDNGHTDIYLSQGNGSFNFVQSFDNSSPDFQIEDFDGDGDLDVFTFDAADDAFELLLNDGSGTFSSLGTLSGPDTVTDMDSGDIDGDGDRDIVYYDGTDFAVLLNDGTGSFGAVSTFASTAADIEALEDFDGDGNLDILAQDGGDFAVLFGNGDGSFGSSQTFESSPGTEVLTADFNNDGALDFVTVQSGFIVYINDGAGNFTRSADGLLGETVSGIDIFDYNNDGIADIIASNYDDGNVEIFIGNGAGGFANQISLNLDGALALWDVAAGDFNGDGIQDFYLISTNNNESFLSDSSEVSAVGDLNVNNAERAGNLLEILDRAVEGLASIQGDIAADLTRAEVALNANLLLSEDLQDAKFNIESADFAIETANLVSAQIQQQAQIAALTQANSNLAVVLQLLDL